MVGGGPATIHTALGANASCDFFVEQFRDARRSRWATEPAGVLLCASAAVTGATEAATGVSAMAYSAAAGASAAVDLFDPGSQPSWSAPTRHSPITITPPRIFCCLVTFMAALIDDTSPPPANRPVTFSPGDRPAWYARVN